VLAALYMQMIFFYCLHKLFQCDSCCTKTGGGVNGQVIFLYFHVKHPVAACFQNLKIHLHIKPLFHGLCPINKTDCTVQLSA